MLDYVDRNQRKRGLASASLKSDFNGRFWHNCEVQRCPQLAAPAMPTDAEGVKATMRGIRRTYGSARVRKAPAVAGKMLGMVAMAPDKLAGLRDRALLLVGFGGALRRSELVALGVENIAETETGLLVTIRGSKTDQERAGATIAIARGDLACPCLSENLSPTIVVMKSAKDGA